MNLTVILGIIIAAAMAFALYAGNNRRKPRP